MHAGISPGCGPRDPPGVGPEAPRCEPGDPPTQKCMPGDLLDMGLETPQARPLNLNFDPGCGPGTPPQTPQLPHWVWNWRPHLRPNHLTSNLGVELETCKACWYTTPYPGDLQGMLVYHPLPWRPARHAGIPPTCPRDLQCMLGYHPSSPVDRMTCKNITFANFVCGR